MVDASAGCTRRARAATRPMMTGRSAVEAVIGGADDLVNPRQHGGPALRRSIAAREAHARARACIDRRGRPAGRSAISAVCTMTLSQCSSVTACTGTRREHHARAQDGAGSSRGCDRRDPCTYPDADGGLRAAVVPAYPGPRCPAWPRSSRSRSCSPASPRSCARAPAASSSTSSAANGARRRDACVVSFAAAGLAPRARLA